ncbi:TA system VapC family ribonuclease toxin [Nocardioides acrostichi]|uniref:Ribonuclease VapC n=1 Tax=Nocardioides acrostichi TaxID=2784339 RepID=A0A930UWF9_9ACTN|nr:TA system VapC family ribonuclease toxin [Nocardioides acrostichi]MBF4162123.1 PIN domain-containing protein [Nocardioides acrostichi]
MLAVDVNVLVSAFHAGAPDHDAMRRWVEDAVDAPEPLGISDAVLIGVARVLTHPRVFSPPASLDDAWTRIGSLAAAEGTARLTPGPRHLQIVERLCRGADARGNLVADAQHAAVAIEHGATWISKDRDFARFPELRWRHPSDAG